MGYEEHDIIDVQTIWEAVKEPAYGDESSAAVYVAGTIFAAGA